MLDSCFFGDALRETCWWVCILAAAVQAVPTASFLQSGGSDSF